jgi:hypothetical protein
MFVFLGSALNIVDDGETSEMLRLADTNGDGSIDFHVRPRNPLLLAAAVYFVFLSKCLSLAYQQSRKFLAGIFGTMECRGFEKRFGGAQCSRQTMMQI